MNDTLGNRDDGSATDEIMSLVCSIETVGLFWNNFYYRCFLSSRETLEMKVVGIRQCFTSSKYHNIFI